MLVPRRTYGLAAVTLLAACAQEPVAPTLASPAVSAALASPAAAPPCTKRWKAAVSGDWSVAANWTPAGVPRAGSVVCLDALGKAPYVVTLSTDATVAVLRVGGGLTAAKATLTFTPAGAGRTLTVTGDAQVAVGGTLRARHGRAADTGGRARAEAVRELPLLALQHEYGRADAADVPRRLRRHSPVSRHALKSRPCRPLSGGGRRNAPARIGRTRCSLAARRSPCRSAPPPGLA